MIGRSHQLSVTRQARLLGLSRASVYYTPQPVPDVELAIMRRIDELHLELPFAGSRMPTFVSAKCRTCDIQRAHERAQARRSGVVSTERRMNGSTARRQHRLL